ncbi:DRC9 protein, partial [Polypterus senegalus]
MRGDHLGDMTSDHSMTRDLDETTFSTTDGLLKVQWDSEEESRQRIKLLQRKLQEIREEKEQEVQRRNEMIAHLKDQRQEKKAKMILEEKYTKKNAELQVFQEQKRCQEQEQDLKNQIEELQEKLEMWMDKYDKDIELKQRELNLLRNSRSNNLAEMQKLAKQFSEYEAVVIQDRREREEEQRKLEQEEREYKASVKVCSIWRAL